MFIRHKKIKGIRYAYLVSNTWDKRKKTSKQKTLKYLGKIIELDKKGSTSFSDFIQQDLGTYINQSQKDKILHDLILHELQKHGFSIADQTRLDDLRYDANLRKILEKKQPVSLKMNEGHMNEHTLKTLFTFELPKKFDEYNDKRPHKLAETLVAAGLEVPKNVFVRLFEKMSKGK